MRISGGYYKKYNIFTDFFNKKKLFIIKKK